MCCDEGAVGALAGIVGSGVQHAKLLEYCGIVLHMCQDYTQLQVQVQAMPAESSLCFG